MLGKIEEGIEGIRTIYDYFEENETEYILYDIGNIIHFLDVFLVLSVLKKDRECRGTYVFLYQ